MENEELKNGDILDSNSNLVRILSKYYTDLWYTTYMDPEVEIVEGVNMDTPSLFEKATGVKIEFCGGKIERDIYTVSDIDQLMVWRMRR